jgi:UV DNA damage repair endonuclease
VDTHFRQVGNVVRWRNVCLFFDSDQLYVLTSNSMDIVDRNIEEFEYYADMVKCTGFEKNP